MDVASRTLILPNEKNCIKRNSDKGKQIIKFSEDFCLKSFLKTCKKLKCTLNEATLSILGQTLKEYAKMNND